MSWNILTYTQPACANRTEVSSICWGTLPEDSMYNPSDPDSPCSLTSEQREEALRHGEVAHQTLVTLGLVEPAVTVEEGCNPELPTWARMTTRSWPS